MADDPLIGQTLVGHRIESLLGQGGMGVVYRARHERLNRVRALKLLPQQLADDQAFRERFEREWRLAASIEHPNIVDVLDAGEAGNHLYILMQFVDGTDLSKLVERDGPLPPDRALTILDQIADALDAAHAQGLIHRDVTPRNILVADGDRAYLADFGVARASGTRSVTRQGFFVGNLDYAAPEQIEGNELDGRADVYALGGCLYTALCGAPPYERESDVQLMYAHLRDPAPAPSVRRPELPRSIDRVVSTAMAKSPDERYSSCGELMDALRTAIDAPARPATVIQERKAATVQDDLGGAVGPPRGEERPKPRLTRRSLVVGAGIVVLAGAAAAAAVVLTGGGGSATLPVVTGKVVEADSGTPLPGVTVEAGDAGSTSGPGGRFTLHDVKKGADVTVPDACGSATKAQASASGQTVTIRLTPLSFTGRATNSLTGKGLANDDIDFDGHTVTTDPDGNFSIKGLCIGRALIVTTPDRPFRRISVTPPDSRKLDLVFAAKPAIETFSDPNLSWFPALSDSNGVSEYKNGEFHMTVTRPFFTLFVYSSFNPDNPDVGVPGSVAMRMRARQVTRLLGHYGFACFENDGRHGYTLEYRTDGFVEIVRWATKSGSNLLNSFVLVPWKRAPSLKRGTATNRLAAECRIVGDAVQLRMAANGHPAASYDDRSGFKPAKFGFAGGTERNVSGVEIAYDDYRLTRLK